MGEGRKNFKVGGVTNYRVYSKFSRNGRMRRGSENNIGQVGIVYQDLGADL